MNLGIRLSRGDQAIVEAVRKAGEHGIASDRLFEKLYSDDPDGGPETGIKSLHTRICVLNKKLRVTSYRVRGEKTGGHRANGQYFLIKLDAAK